MRWNESKLIVKIERWENFRAEQEAQVMEMKELCFVGVTNGEFVGSTCEQRGRKSVKHARKIDFDK